ncbi:hypothetical protein IWQ57_004070, partial [Coemansia nantahalensis]
MSLTISTKFGPCVLAAVSVALQCEFTAWDVDTARRRYNMVEPDSDGGQLESQPSDEGRAKFKRIKHIRESYLEHLTTVLSLLLLAGLFYPTLSACLGNMYVLGRAAYSWFYTRDRPEAR